MNHITNMLLIVLSISCFALSPNYVSANDVEQRQMTCGEDVRFASACIRMGLLAGRLHYNQENFFPLPEWVLAAPDDVKSIMGIDKVRERAARYKILKTEELDKETGALLADNALEFLCQLWAGSGEPFPGDSNIDPYSSDRVPFRYIAWTGENGFYEDTDAEFVLISCGPDGDDDIDLNEYVRKSRTGELDDYLKSRVLFGSDDVGNDGDIILMSRSHLGWRLMRNFRTIMSVREVAEAKRRETEVVDKLVNWAMNDWYIEAETPAGR